MSMIQQPPILRGTDTERIVRIHKYLYQIARDLNSALNNLDAENFADGSSAAQILKNGATDAQKKELDKSFSTLRSLIIKTSDTVQAEMDVLETTLKSSYVAKSDLGTLEETIDNKITASANGLTQEIEKNSEIFNQYKTTTQGYIHQGIVGHNDAGEAIIGIAIGQKIEALKNADGSVVTEIVENTEYEVINTLFDMSIWTPNKMAFYVNGSEIAHFSNSALNVDVVIVKEKIVLQENKWEISHAKGFTIKWIGG